MVCPLCPTVGFLGGVIGSSLGVRFPTSFKGRLVSVLTTGSLVTLTVIVLKKLFDFSLCQGGGFTLRTVALILAPTFVMGIIYSIGVNYLLNRYFFATPPAPLPPVTRSPCCCQANVCPV